MKKKTVDHFEAIKRICIIRSNSVNPDSRVEKEADALMAAGYDVHILAWDRDSNHKPNKSYIQNRIPVTRIGYKSGYGEGLHNLGARIGFQVGMVKWILQKGKKLNAIHACDIDTALFSYLPARVTGCKFVYDIFDFICAEPENLFQWMVKKAQQWVINHADATIICTEQRREQIKGTNPKKLVVIHNTPDERVKSAKSTVKVDHDHLSVVYIGVLLKMRLLDEMIHYFKNNPSKDFYIGGFGQMEENIQHACKKYKNIHFLGRIQYDQTLAIEKQCDIMVAAYDLRAENHRMAAPNKFYESLMLGKPIIMVRGMGMSEEVEKEDIGVLIDYSEESFGEGLDKLEKRREEWAEMGQRARTLYDDKYSWNMMEGRLVNLYKELIEK